MRCCSMRTLRRAVPAVLLALFLAGCAGKDAPPEAEAPAVEAAEAEAPIEDAAETEAPAFESAVVERFDTDDAVKAGAADAACSVTEEETLASLTSALSAMRRAGESTGRPMDVPRLRVTLSCSDGSTQFFLLDSHRVACFDDFSGNFLLPSGDTTYAQIAQLLPEESG